MKRANQTDCAPFREQASAWLDAEAHDAARLQEHLAACGACRSHVEALRALSARFAAVRDGRTSRALEHGVGDEAASDLWPRIEARVRVDQRPAKRVALRAAAALLGCAPTAALLGWLDAGSEPGRASVVSGASTALGADAGVHDPWPAALREPSVDLAWRRAPEQRLLAAFDRSPAARSDHEHGEGAGDANAAQEPLEERR